MFTTLIGQAAAVRDTIAIFWVVQVCIIQLSINSSNDKIAQKTVREKVRGLCALSASQHCSTLTNSSTRKQCAAYSPNFFHRSNCSLAVSKRPDNSRRIFSTAVPWDYLTSPHCSTLKNNYPSNAKSFLDRQVRIQTATWFTDASSPQIMYKSQIPGSESWAQWFYTLRNPIHQKWYAVTSIHERSTVFHV